MNEIFESVRRASYSLSRLTENERTDVLLALADATEAHIPQLLAANADDLSRMSKAIRFTTACSLPRLVCMI